MKRFAAYGAILLLMFPLMGCRHDDEKIVAHVNKDTITETEFNNRTRDIDAAQLVATAQQNGPAKAGVFAMEDLIHEKEVLQFGAEKKALPTDAQIDSYITFAKKFQDPKFQPFTLLSYDPYRSEEDWRRQVRMALVMRNVMLASSPLKEEDIKAFYERVKGALTESEQYHLRVILSRTPQKAEETLASIKKGLPFETAALKLSDDPQARQKSGDIGWTPANNLPPQMKAAVKNLKLGDYTHTVIEYKVPAPPNRPSTPSVTEYLIAQMLEKKPAHTPTFDEVRPLCENGTLQEKYSSAFQLYMASFQSFQDKADIRIVLKPYDELIKIKTNSNSAPSSAPLPSSPGS